MLTHLWLYFIVADETLQTRSLADVCFATFQHYWLQTVLEEFEATNKGLLWKIIDTAVSRTVVEEKIKMHPKPQKEWEDQIKLLWVRMIKSRVRIFTIVEECKKNEKKETVSKTKKPVMKMKMCASSWRQKGPLAQEKNISLGCQSE